MWLLEYGKGNYWTGDKMVEHAVHVALPIFRYAFPNCQALFALDKASNHCSFSDDALVAKRTNLKPGGQQPIMREVLTTSIAYVTPLLWQMTYHPNSPD